MFMRQCVVLEYGYLIWSQTCLVKFTDKPSVSTIVFVSIIKIVGTRPPDSIPSRSLDPTFWFLLDQVASWQTTHEKSILLV